MKKITIGTLLLAFATTSFSQQTVQKHSMTKTDYLQKSKRQKTFAWICTGVGVSGLALTIMFVTVANDLDSEFAATVPYFISGACVASGIVLFVASGKNKKKAMAASAFLNMEKVPVLQGTSVISQSFPAIGLKIKI